MRRFFVMAAILVGLFLIQTAVIASLFPIAVTPNLLLIFVVSFSFMCGQRTGIFVGFFTGLLVDIFTSGIFGFHALLYLFTGYCIGYFYKVFFDEDLKVPIMLVAICDFFYGCVYYLFMVAGNGRYGFSEYLRFTILPEIFATILLTIILYKLLFLVNSKLSAYELEGRQSPWL